MAPPDRAPVRSAAWKFDVLETFYTLQAQIAFQPPPVPSSEHALLTIIVLQRFYAQLADECEWSKSARATLGAMIQRRLTLFLCEIDESQHTQLMSLPYTRGLLTNGKDFGKEIAGALACASVIKSLLASRPAARIFLSTVEEDVHLGLDFYWAEEGLGAAVSVKWDSEVEGIRAYVASRNISKRNTQLKAELRRVREGTIKLNARLNMSWLPVLVHTNKSPKVNDELPSVPPNAWCENLIEKIAGNRDREATLA
jgi:hypothetical protein